MQISFLIVTKNRPVDLALTLNKLKPLLNLQHHEVCVFVDGCLETEQIVKEFSWVNWTISKKSMSASPARAQLYKKAKGTFFIGLDDDAHPLTKNFIAAIEYEFKTDASIGILALKEVRGLFNSDEDAIKKVDLKTSYFTSDFVGCGFAMSKTAYSSIVGFPVFIDIYGEESCVALQVLDVGFNIKYVPYIAVNHRVDVEKRKLQKRNYYRFAKQLKNSMRMFLVYYPKPLKSILKLLFHNFKKYALTDFKYFKIFVKVVFIEIFNISSILKYRKPLKTATISKIRQLKGLKYS